MSNSIYNSLDILFKVVIQKLKKHQEFNAINVVYEIQEIENKINHLKISDIEKYNKITDGLDIESYFKDKYNLLIEFANENNCLSFLRNLSKTIQHWNLDGLESPHL